MKNLSRYATMVIGAVAVATLSACATGPNYGRPAASYPAQYPAPVAQPAPYPVYDQGGAYAEFGRVSNIEVLQAEQARAPSGAGAIIGGVLGAVVGNQIEGNQRWRVVQTYRISVQVDNGSSRAFDVPAPGDLRIGDRVRIQGGQLQRI